MHFVKTSRCSWLVENENHTIPDVMLLWYVFPCVTSTMSLNFAFSDG